MPEHSLTDYAAEFDQPEGYLDFARFGPPSRAVVRTLAELTTRASTAGADTVDVLHEGERRATAAAARLSGFAERDVVLTPNTSTGLFQAALGMSGGTVLVSPAEFAANVVPWRRAAELGRITVAELSTPDGYVTPEAVRSAFTREVSAVACSAVDFHTGYRADLAGIREVIGDALLVVDAVQGFGVADEPWRVADVVVTGGQKWLRAGWGTGFLAVSDRARDRLGPALTGWTGVPFEITKSNPIAAAGFAEALELVERTGVGRIESAVARRVDELLALLPGVRVPDRRAGIVAVPVDHPERIRAALAEQGVTVTGRDGSIRLSVHACTTSATLARAARLVRELR